MFGLGTIINVGCIIVGGLIGLFFGKKISERFRKIMLDCDAVAIIIIGILGIVAKFKVVKDGVTDSGTLMLLSCLFFGSILGELINFDKLFDKFGNWLKIKVKSQNDPLFIDGFLTATFTVCIGAMAIIGSIEDGISGKIDVLLAKSIMDGIFLIIITSTYGKGCIFAFIPVFILQGSITLIFHFVGSSIPTAITNNISFVGSALILCIGINLMFDKKIKVANMLPSIVLAALYGLIPIA